MKRFFASLTLLSLLTPLSTFAFEKPSELLMAIGQSNNAITSTTEVHFHVVNEEMKAPEFWMSMWITSSSQGSLQSVKNIRSLKASGSMTVDFATKNLSLRVKGQWRLLRGDLFFIVDDVNAKMENDDLKSVGSFILKRWIVIPSKLLFPSHLSLPSSQDLQAAYQMFDPAIVLSQGQRKGGSTEYTITLSEEILNNIRRVAEVAAEGKLMVDDSNRLTNGSLNFELHGPLSPTLQIGKFDATVKMNVAQSSKPLTVVRPTNTVSLEEFALHLQALGMDDPFSRFPTMPAPDYEPSAMGPLDEETPSSDWYDVDPAEQPSSPTLQVTPTVPELPGRDARISQRLRRQILDQRKPTKTVPGVRGTRTGSAALLTGDALSFGDANAPVTIVEFTDMQCPFCQRFMVQTYPEIFRDYIQTNKVNFVVRHYPLAFHPYATDAAKIVECARRENASLTGKFYLQAMEKAAGDSESLNAKTLLTLAQSMGLDSTIIGSCMDEDATAVAIQADADLATRFGVNGTPAFFVIGPNGEMKMISGAMPYSAFKEAIEEMLK